MKLITIAVSLGFAHVLAYAGTIERPPAGEKIAPYISAKITAFTFSDGIDGTDLAIKYELHNIELMIGNNIPMMTFEVENGKVGTPTYFKAKYRVLYMTKPLSAVAVTSPFPIPTPPFFGSPASSIYVLGTIVAPAPIGAPKATPWLRVDSLQLNIE